MPPQPRLSSKLTQVLAHWDVGADPATYDWAAKQQQITTTLAATNTESEGQQQQSESSSSSSSQSTEKKKAKRRKQRLMRESLSFSQPIKAGEGGGSQPALGGGMVDGSQPVGGGEGSRTQEGAAAAATQDGGGLVAMSQPVPGRHAARLGKDGRKKKRKPGF